MGLTRLRLAAGLLILAGALALLLALRGADGDRAGAEIASPPLQARPSAGSVGERCRVYGRDSQVVLVMSGPRASAACRRVMERSPGVWSTRSGRRGHTEVSCALRWGDNRLAVRDPAGSRAGAPVCRAFRAAGWKRAAER
jgi:hypothetical protein